MPNTLDIDLLDKLRPIKEATQQLWLASLWNISRRHRRELVLRMQVITEGSDETFTAL